MAVVEKVEDMKTPLKVIFKVLCQQGATRHSGHFPYKSDKAVPWKYQGKSVAKSKQTEEVVNLARVGNMTRSGRVYSPVDLSKKSINASKGKEKIVETSEDRPEPEVTELFPEKMEREVSEEEAYTIAMVEDGQLESDLGPVYQCIPGTGLRNWTEEDVASDSPTNQKQTNLIQTTNHNADLTMNL
ncbi:hypothetical protein Lal_00035362 [Lupinus albus]|nr:hypothetical protein Lal_00035362 [Lupinus albus]